MQIRWLIPILSLAAAAVVVLPWRSIWYGPAASIAFHGPYKTPPEKLSLKFCGYRDKIDFQAMDLAGKEIFVCSFFNTNLNRISFKNATISGVGFFSGKATQADFSGSNILGSYFQNTNLKEAQFQGAHLKNVVFASADLRESDFRGAVLEDTQFILARLEKARFDRYTLLPFSKEEALHRGMIYVE